MLVRLTHFTLSGLVLLSVSPLACTPPSQQPPNQRQKFTSPSITEFGFDSTRSGVAKTASIPWPQLDLKKLTYKALQSASNFKPLYINGKEISQGLFKDRRVLLYSDKNFLIAFDIDKEEKIWSVQLKRFIGATPVVDLKTQSIFALTRTKVDHHYEHFLTRVNFDGKKHSSQRVGFQPNKNQNFPQRVHCKTALGLNRAVKVPFVYFGCSIATWPKKYFQYGSQRGVRGSVIAIPIDSNTGQIAPAREHKAFITSEISDTPHTGYDTGVYNIGAGPSHLPDGSFLVATGNGPVLLNENNFGCSVVRVNPKTMSVMEDKKGHPYAWSLDQPGFNECWRNNIEYSSSSVASLVFENRMVSAVGRKDGVLTVFDPEAMNHRPAKRQEFKIGVEASYGQPFVFKKSQTDALIVHLAKTYPHSSTESIFLSAGKTGKSKKCLGYLLKQSKTPANSLSLLYSGKLRDQYRNALTDSKDFKELNSLRSVLYGANGKDWQSEKLNAPFKKIANLGSFMSKSQGLSLIKNKNNLELASINKLKAFLKIEKSKKDLYFLKTVKPQKSCDQSTMSLTPIYESLHTKNSEFKKLGVQATAFAVGAKDLKAANLWTTFLENRALYNTNAVFVDRGQNHNPFLVFNNFALNGQNYITILDGLSGDMILDKKWSSQTYFSMPLVVDDLLFIATRNDGIKTFQFTPKKTSWF